jgi:hypothetical protein
MVGSSVEVWQERQPSANEDWIPVGLGRLELLACVLWVGRKRKRKLNAETQRTQRKGNERRSEHDAERREFLVSVGMAARQKVNFAWPKREKRVRLV